MAELNNNLDIDLKSNLKANLEADEAPTPKTRFLWEYLRSSKKPIVLYGTGDGADKILAVMKRFGIEPAAFTASDDFARGQTFEGFKVKPLAEIQKEFKNPIILTCFGSDREDVLENILALSKKYEVYAPDVPLIGDLSEIYDYNYVEKHSKDLDRARSLFADVKSKEIFDKWLDYRLNGEIKILEEVASPREETLSLLNINQNEYFIDAGAFKGDTVDEFLRLTEGKFGKIIALEPDLKNFLALRRRFYAYGSGLLLPVNAAVWDEETTLVFEVKTGRGGKIINSALNSPLNSGFNKNKTPARKIEIPAVTLDNLCKSETAKYLNNSDYVKHAKTLAHSPPLNPTLIKMDVEGAEAQGIKGAREIIAKHKPKLLISLYHKTEDMFALPLLVNSINPKYKFYLRKTRCIPGWEFNLIAI